MSNQDAYAAPKTAAERQRARRQRLADAGLAQVTVIVPARREAEIQRIAEQMRLTLG